MQITIIAVGSLKERYWKDACHEYLKRLGPYAKVDVREIAEERVSNEESTALVELALQSEADRIRKALPSGATIVALDVLGGSLTSEELAAYLDKEETYGRGNFAFIIGGSYGLHRDLLSQSALRLSFSAFTFPHQLMRVILLEQIYRAMKIRRKEAYHK